MDPQSPELILHVTDSVCSLGRDALMIMDVSCDRNTTQHLGGKIITYLQRLCAEVLYDASMLFSFNCRQAVWEGAGVSDSREIKAYWPI